MSNLNDDKGFRFCRGCNVDTALMHRFSFRYIYGCVGQDELAAFYRDAAVALVTPLRDGMNLVAKEFVACQINKTPGVLIVSPFAGAGEMMHEALICNPYELDDAAEIIHR